MSNSGGNLWEIFRPFLSGSATSNGARGASATPKNQTGVPIEALLSGPDPHGEGLCLPTLFSNCGCGRHNLESSCCGRGRPPEGQGFVSMQLAEPLAILAWGAAPCKGGGIAVRSLSQSSAIPRFFAIFRYFWQFFRSFFAIAFGFALFGCGTANFSQFFATFLQFSAIYSQSFAIGWDPP